MGGPGPADVSDVVFVVVLPLGLVLLLMVLWFGRVWRGAQPVGGGVVQVDAHVPAWKGRVRPPYPGA